MTDDGRQGSYGQASSIPSHSSLAQDEPIPQRGGRVDQERCTECLGGSSTYTLNCKVLPLEPGRPLHILWAHSIDMSVFAVDYFNARKQRGFGQILGVVGSADAQLDFFIFPQQLLREREPRPIVWSEPIGDLQTHAVLCPL